MKNVLLDRLPTEWESPDGSVYSIDTDFRIGVQICLIQDDLEMTKIEKAVQTAKLLFDEEVPSDADDIEECVAFFLNGWFHDNETEKKERRRMMDFDVDQWRIYSAFLSQYRIDLDSIEYMHFWKFMGLLSSLQECAYTRVIDIRQRKFRQNMDAEEKKQLKEAKEIYYLPEIRSVEQQQEDEAIYDFLGGTVSEQEKNRIAEFEKFAEMEEDEE